MPRITDQPQVEQGTVEDYQASSAQPPAVQQPETPGMQQQGQPKAYERSAVTSTLVEVIDRILDKGIVIYAWAKISLIGIELITIEARVVVASVDTYLRYAEALRKTQRLPQG